MDHSTDVYLVGPDGVLRNHIFYGAGPDLIAQLVRAIL
jgi:cytochrome oxidase Cu insertion factor (SCO1/SenC/PrrC family)